MSLLDYRRTMPIITSVYEAGYEVLFEVVKAVLNVVESFQVLNYIQVLTANRDVNLTATVNLVTYAAVAELNQKKV